MMNLEDCLKLLNKYRSNELVVCTMTQILYWPFISKSKADVIYTDPMGSAPSLALGMALGRPDVRVWLFNGDGSLLMQLSSLVTISNARPSNLVFFLFDNRMYGRPGVALPGGDSTDFCALARGAGLEHVLRFTNITELDSAMPGIKSSPGPVFVDLVVTWSDTEDSAYGQRSAFPESAERYGRNGVRNIRKTLASH